MQELINFNTGTPIKEGWYLVIGSKGGITSAYFSNGDFWWLNVLNPLSQIGMSDRRLCTYMQKITNIIGWSKSI